MTCPNSNRKQFWGGLGPGPGSPGSLALPLPSLEGERSIAEGIGGPGLRHAAVYCLVLALGWWFEGLLKAVEMSETSALSFADLPILHFPLCLSYVFLSVTSTGFAVKGGDN